MNASESYLPFGRDVVVEGVVVWMVVKSSFAEPVVFESWAIVVVGVVMFMVVKFVLIRIVVLGGGTVLGEIVVPFMVFISDLADAVLLFNGLGPNFLCLIELKSNLLDFSPILGMLTDLEGNFVFSFDLSFVTSIALELTTIE